MRYELLLAPSAVADYRALSAFERAQVRDALEQHLRFEPTRVSRSRIKRLRGLERPQYRLRVDETRVFYDVRENEVGVLAIVPKTLAQEWLDGKGTPAAQSGPRRDEG